MQLALAQGLLSVTWKSFSPQSQLLIAASSLVALSLFEQANKYTQKLLIRGVAYDIVSDIRIALFDRLMTLSMRFFHANHSGKLMSRLTNDLNNLGSLLTDVLIDMTTDFFTLLGYVIYLWVLGGWVVLAAVGVAVISFVPVQQISHRIRRKELSNQGRMGALFMSLSEIFGAQKIVKAFNAEGHERQRFRKVNDSYTTGKKKAAELRARVEPAVQIVGRAGCGGAGLHRRPAGHPRHLGQGRLHRDHPAARAGRRGHAPAGRRQRHAARRPLLRRPRGHRALQRARVLRRPGRARDHRPAARLHLRPRQLRHDPEHPVLRDITFALPKGRTLALVGHTGSGKTTLADLLPRFFDVTKAPCSSTAWTSATCASPRCAARSRS